MPPPLQIHSLPTLESAVNYLPNGKPRKPPVKLLDCPLKELVQYKCNLHFEEGHKKATGVLCQPVVRLFRQCGNGLNIETTAWEKWNKERKDGAKCLR